jgi:hypothetical protein
MTLKQTRLVITDVAMLTRFYESVRQGGHVARGDKWRFVSVGAWPATVFSLLIGDLMRCTDTFSSIHLRRYEIHV